ncbi:dUTP pyrophosphatase [Rhizobium viscosum]|uniref:dCTP deaminase n=1 Tax=Rhizobium viscosum TaxID=1673 RepID=A0ABR9IV36_RHIVS|nr:deoxycytidine triphosphate deaminase [Rhizobium viscosum]MBE1506995.1 dCTP deaminase [Rhizobium viscosum]
MFWSGKKLSQEINRIFDPHHQRNIDCNAYTLHVGDEVYVSIDGKPRDENVARKLTEGEHFVIPPGQFCFLLTQEVLTIPHDAMALINVKSGIKLSGLVNVSGFHVDPGYRGKLVISVFNAGPKPVVLSEGEPCFLIWLATLDGEVDIKYSKGYELGYMHITPKLVQSIPSINTSIHTISDELKELRSRVELVFAIVLGVGIPFFVALLVAVLQVVLGKWVEKGEPFVDKNVNSFLIYIAAIFPILFLCYVFYKMYTKRRDSRVVIKYFPEKRRNDRIPGR